MELGLVVPARPCELHHVRGDLVQVDGHRLGEGLDAAEALDATDDLGAILAGLAHDFEGPEDLGIPDLALEELRPAEDDREQVVQVMRHPGRELADGAEGLVAHRHDLRGPEVVDDVLELLRGTASLLEEPGVVDRVADIGHQGVEELELDGGERLRAGGRAGTRAPLLRHVQDADGAVPGADRHADERPVPVVGGARTAEAGVTRDVLDQDRLAELQDAAGDALPHPHLRRGRCVARKAPGGDEPERLTLGIQDHDRADGGPHRAHGVRQHEAQQVLDPGDVGGQLDRLVQGPQLEDEILQSLRRAPQVLDHAAEGAPDLGDLRDLGGLRDQEGPGGDQAGRLAGPGGRLEVAGEPPDPSHHPPQGEQPEDSHDHGRDQAEPGLSPAEQTGPHQEIREEEVGEDDGAGEDDRRHPVEAHRGSGTAGALHSSPHPSARGRGREAKSARGRAWRLVARVV